MEPRVESSYSKFRIPKRVEEFPLSLSYIDLMTDAGRYVKSEDGVALNPSQEALNKSIEEKGSFNVIVYTEIIREKIGTVISRRERTCNDYYEFSTVNGYNLEKDIYPYKSVALYDINSLDINFPVKDNLPEEWWYNTTLEICVSVEELTADLETGAAVPYYHELCYLLSLKGVTEDKPKEEEEKEEDQIGPDFVISPDEDEEGGSSETKPQPGDPPTNRESYTVTISNPEYEKYVFLNSCSVWEMNNVETDEHIEIESTKEFDPETNTTYIKKKGTLTSLDNYIRVHVEPTCMQSFSYTLNEKKSNGTVVAHNYTYTPNTINVSGSDYPRVQKMNNPNVSYSLLRVNPKLTGNVKVVVDSNSNMYLDTFKVSTALQQKRYRHVKLNSEEYYGQTLMTKYKDIPSTDFYKIENKCYNLFTTAQTYNAQYYDMYRYGVKTNDDKMYSENFALLAPLCIKEVMPDFFVVFKVDVTKEDYNDSAMSDDEKIKYFIQHGTIVKSYDMRKDSTIGKYIRTIYNKSNEYPGDAYVSHSSSNHNKFIGISIDRGAVTSMYESTFAEEQIHSQVAMNDFYTAGFERNRLVSKNIINFEFMFNDPSAELFSIDTYFGLYIRLNGEANEFSCIGSHELVVDGSGEDEEPTTTTVYDFDSSINTFPIGTVLSEKSRYSNLIYGLSTPSEFIKLDCGINDAPAVKNYMLKPYKNIYSEQVKKLDADMCTNFLTMNLTQPLEVGDHIRVIDVKDNTIYEVIVSNSTKYLDEHSITETTKTFFRNEYTYYTINYVSMYSPFRSENLEEVSEDENPSVDLRIAQQIEQLYYAFKKFKASNVFTPLKYNGRFLSFIGFKDDLVFERICSPSGFTEEQKIYLEENDTENTTIEFFNKLYADKITLDIENTAWKYSPYAYLYPMHFEVVGNRMAHVMSFVSLNKGDSHLYSGILKDPRIFDNVSVVYKSLDDDGYVLYKDIEFNTFSVDNGNIVPSVKTLKYTPSYDNSEHIIFNVQHPELINNTLNLYTVYPLNAGICSILQLKDFDFNVLDSTSVIANNSKDSSIGDAGEFTRKSIFNYPPEEEGVPSDYVDSAGNVYIYTKPSHVIIEDLALDNETNYIDINVDDTSIRYYKFPMNTQIIDETLSKDELKYIAIDPADKLLYTPYISGTRSINYASAKVNSVLEFDLISSLDGYESSIRELFADDEKNPDEVTMQDVVAQLGIYNSGQDESNKFDINRIGGWVVVGTYVSPASYITEDTYSDKPIRNTPEECVKDYFDKYRLFYYDSSLANKPDISSDHTFSNDEINKYYYNLFVNNHTSSDISLIAPHTCKWKGIGTDARGDSMRVMFDYENLSNPGDSSLGSYYAVGSNTYSKYLGLLSYNSADSSVFNKYIPRSLNSLTKNFKYDSSLFGSIEKDYILEGNGSLDDILYNNKNYQNRFSVVYNAGEDTIEFISAGVKFRLKTNNNDAVNLTNYNGYSAVFVSLPDISKSYARQTELIIDETKKEIMFVWYQAVNTFKYGASYFNSQDVISPGKMYMCKLPQLCDFKDIECSYIDNVSVAKIPDILKFGAGSLANQRKLCNKTGIIWMGSTVVDNNTYTKYNRLALTGRLNYNFPGTNIVDLNEKYPYYCNENCITVNNPILWHNYSQDYASNSVIDAYAYDYNPSIETYLVTDSPEYIINNIGTFESLKSAVKSCAVYIKTAEGKKDYTNFKNLLSVSVIEPILKYRYEGLGKDKSLSRLDKKEEKPLGYVHSSYIEPVMKDMFKFNYTSSETTDDNTDPIETIFRKSFDGANIYVNGINTIDQIWFNKYTEEFNYCITSQHNDTDEEYLNKTSLDVKHNVSLMNDAWNLNLYRNYFASGSSEQYETVAGYKTGYELKTFIHSRGINLNGADGNTIEITSWKNTMISEENQYIKLDITDSVVYNILFRSSFNKYWKYLNLSDNTFKINYIKNTILPFVNINNKTKFVLYKDEQLLNSLYFNSELDENQGQLVMNYKNELKYENGKYYMYVYPEEMTAYFAKMIITL